MKTLWPTREPDRINIAQSRTRWAQMGYKSPIPNSVPFTLTPGNPEIDFYRHHNAQSMEIYNRYGITDPPTKDSTMDPQKLIEMFLEMLKLYDSSAEEFKGYSMLLKMWMNRRWNNAHKDAMEHFWPNEFAVLNEQMRVRRIGETNK